MYIYLVKLLYYVQNACYQQVFFPTQKALLIEYDIFTTEQQRLPSLSVALLSPYDTPPQHKIPVPTQS